MGPRQQGLALFLLALSAASQAFPASPFEVRPLPGDRQPELQLHSLVPVEQERADSRTKFHKKYSADKPASSRRISVAGCFGVIDSVILLLDCINLRMRWDYSNGR